MAGVSDEAFARYINEIGNATMEQIEAAQREQVVRARAGNPISLGDVLVEQGVLTPAIRENVEKKLIARQDGGIKTLGNYKLIKKLGEGGMGAVYLAEDTLAGRKVALKVLPKKHAGDSEFLTRFRREAKATGKLNHVNIVSAFSVGEELGNHFYAMEYCDGEPLDAKLKREQVLPWDKAAEITMQVARGLKHAHEHGFIHRDIKPANIFITAEGVAKILDLGLSKNILDAEQSFNTQTGVAMGTPHYISPEQAKGEKTIDGRTDIYSLGATLYHLVTGQTPFQGSTAAMIMMKHLSDQLPNPQDIREDIPDSVVHVIQKMMAKDPTDRYADCAELLTDLELVIDGKSPSSLALDVGKSSIAMPRMRKADAAAAADRMRGGRKGATNRPEPLASRRGTERGADHSEAAPAKKNQTPLLIGGGVAAVGVLILVVALMKGGSKPPAAPDDGKSAENKAYTTVALPVPGPATAAVTPQPQPTSTTAMLPKLWATYWTGTQDNWFQQFHFGRAETKLSRGWIGKPDPRLPAENYAVRWVGVIRITEANSYRFSATSDAKLRMWFDGKEVGVAPNALGVKLTPGDYPVLIEFFDNIGGAPTTTIRWTYQRESGWHDLPPEILFHSVEQETNVPVQNPTVSVAKAPGVSDEWIKFVQALPAEAQAKAVETKLRELNPKSRGEFKPTIRDDKVEKLWVSTDHVSDLTPLKALGSLEHIDCRASRENMTSTDLAGLKGLPLKFLVIHNTKARDLTPLAGMPLQVLICSNCLIEDFSPLKGLPLKELELDTPEKCLDILKSIKTLQRINKLPVAEFWKKYPDTGAAAPPAAGSKAIDLLSLMEKKELFDVKLVNSELVLNGNFTVYVPYTPPEEYDLKADFTREQGDGKLGFLFGRSGNLTVLWQMSMNANTLMGFSDVKGIDAQKNTLRVNKALQNGTRQNLVLEVRKDRVSVILNAEKITEWRPEHGTLHFSDAKGCLVAIDTKAGNTGRIHRLEVIEISGPGTFKRPESAPAQEAKKKQDEFWVKPR